MQNPDKKFNMFIENFVVPRTNFIPYCENSKVPNVRQKPFSILWHILC